MAKRYFDLYPQVIAWENLEWAYRRARKGKRGRAPAADFERRLEDNLVELQADLTRQTYRPGAYRSFTIHEPKRRLISAAPFRDRVVHHALCHIIEPLFERTFIFDSYANRIGKGTHRALDRAQYFARRYRYALPLDIVQFFPSVDHIGLRSALSSVIGDERVMGLCDVILASGQGVQAEEYGTIPSFGWDRPDYFPDEDATAPERARGLPIGNLTSQFWANVYLNHFDHFVKRALKCCAYLRFVDDFVLFDDDKERLHEWRRQIITYLAGLRLRVHEERAQPRPVTEGLPFLGFTVYPDHRRLKAPKALSFRRKFRQQIRALAVGAITLSDLHASVSGWANHARYGDTWRLRTAVLSAPILKWEP